jgi:hypothetical protein
MKKAGLMFFVVLQMGFAFTQNKTGILNGIGCQNSGL